MKNAWGLATLAAGFVLCGHVAVATAQSVLVRNAEPGTVIEVVVNADTAGKATVDTAREARIATNFLGDAAGAQADGRVSVDACADLRRVIISEPGKPMLPEQPGCIRTDVTGIFVVRRASWLVVDLGGAAPSVMLLQRPYGSEARIWGRAPGGLVLFGGGTLATFSNAAEAACGDVTPCTDGGYGAGFSAGAAFWVTRYTAAEVTFVRPRKSTVSGSGTTNRFTSDLDAELITIAGQGGIPAGPVRFYGKAGMNYHRAVTTHAQTIDDRTVTVDGAPVTIAGGTQSNAFETRGWGWVFGGGMEAWVTPYFALYGEFGRARLKGDAAEGEGILDDRLTSYTIGGRLRLWR